MEYIKHARAPRSYKRYYPEDDKLWWFAANFHYEGFDVPDKKELFGEIWCEADDNTDKFGDGIIIIRCWYTQTTPVFAKRKCEPDIVIDICIDPCESDFDPIYYIHNDVWNTNANWKQTLLLSALKAP